MRLEKGTPAPDFSLLDDRGERLALHDLRGSRVILFAYPAAMTPGCTTEACDFRDSLAPIQQAGYAVVGISPDQPSRLAEFRQQEHLTYPLLSDPDHRVLEAYGAWGEKSLYGKTVVGVIRSTFVISPDGLVEHAFYNVKATGHVAKIHKHLGLS